MKNILNKLGSISTLYFVCIYIVLIPFFATVYYYLPDRSFYHSTSMYEYGDLEIEADYLLKDFRKTFISSNLNFCKDSVLRNNGWTLNLNQIYIKSINVVDFPNSIDFNMRLSLIHDDGIQLQTISIITLHVRDKILANGEIKCATTYDKTTKMNDSILPQGVNSFFKTSNDSNEIALTPLIDLTPDLWTKLIYFGQAYRGFPNRQIEGHWFRMLYLSSGIATSTLIGDIIPITKVSRFWITFQGIIFILVIGLILNALGNDIIKMKSKAVKKHRRKEKIN